MLLLGCGDQASNSSRQWCHSNDGCDGDQECRFSGKDAVKGLCVSKELCIFECDDGRSCGVDDTGEQVCGGAVEPLGVKTTVFQMIAGKPISEQLDITGVTAGFYTVAEPGTTPPEGLGLTTNGLIAGTINMPGNYAIQIRIYNHSNPETTYFYNQKYITVSVTLTVQPDNCTHNCSGFGVCDQRDGSCDCDTGYRGTICSQCDTESGYVSLNGTCVASELLCSHHCSNHGACDLKNGSCSCDMGYDGATCELCDSGYIRSDDNIACVLAICSHNCSGKGVCDETDGSCECITGYAGAICNSCDGDKDYIVDTETGDCIRDDSLKDGDLIITELLPDATGDDTGKEWVELYNSSDRILMIDGGTLINTKSDNSEKVINFKTVSGSDITLNPGAYLLLNGGEGDLTGTLALYNEAATLKLIVSGKLIDTITYTKPNEGYSFSLDPAALTGVGNDDGANWCVPLEDTAGVKNKPCNAACIHECSGVGICHFDGSCSCDTGYAGDICDQCDSSKGYFAPSDSICRRAMAGDLIITELLPDIVGSDTDREWVELYNTGSVDIPFVKGNFINIKESGNKNNFAITPPIDGEVVWLKGGTFNIVASKSADFSRELYASLGLYNDAASLSLEIDGVTIDTISYADPVAGQATQLDVAHLSGTENDDLGNWCGTETATPGAVNSSCGISNLCDHNCSGNGVCNDLNGICNCNTGYDGDLCDICDEAAGYYSDGSGNCIDGNTLKAGDIIITEMMADPSGSDSDREWIEIYNTTGNTIVLVDFVVIRETGDTLKRYAIKESGTTIAAYSHFVIADKVATTSLLPQVDATASLSLNNTGDHRLKIEIDQNGTPLILDEIIYSGSETGISWQLDSESYSSSSNDFSSNWCAATATISGSNGDLGTPGAKNSRCQ